jgi:peroxiredoxin
MFPAFVGSVIRRLQQIPRRPPALRRSHGWLGVLFVALALLAPRCGSSRHEALHEAPPFDLPRLEGKGSLTLEDLRGQYVLMNFWASWCGPCGQEIPALESIHRRFAGTGLTVLGVTVSDQPEDSREFVLRLGASYLNVIGDDDMAEDYRLSPWIPVTLLIGPDRRVLKQWSGPQTEASFLEGIRAAAPDLRAAAAQGPAGSGLGT